MTNFGRALLLADPINSYYNVQEKTQSIAQRAQQIRNSEIEGRINEFNLKKAEAAQKDADMLIPVNQIVENYMPRATKGQVDDMMKLSNSMGLIENNAIKKANIGKIMEYFNTDVGKARLLQNVDIGIGDVDKSLASVTASMKKIEAENPEAKPEELMSKKDKETGLQYAQLQKLKQDYSADQVRLVNTKAELSKAQKSQKSDIGAVSPDKYTPASIQKFNISGNYADLVPVEGESKVPSNIPGEIKTAMADLGIDITDPKAYTPKNISRASAHRRKLEAQDRAEKNEQLTAGQRAMIAHQLRGELRADPYVKNWKDIDQKYEVMQAAYDKAKSGNLKSYVAVDQALITLYNKMTDPTSVVRESEYARTAENQSVVNALLGKIDKWRQGGAGLTPVEREALVEMGREFYTKYAENYNQIVFDYESTAVMSGINPQQIGVPFRKANPEIGVISPDGKKGTIPLQNLEKALSRGYKRI